MFLLHSYLELELVQFIQLLYGYMEVHFVLVPMIVESMVQIIYLIMELF